MWAAIWKDWDYLALSFLLGVHVTAAVALAISLIGRAVPILLTKPAGNKAHDFTFLP